MTNRRAVVDESYSSLSTHYLMPAVAIDDASTEDITATASSLRRPARCNFHWWHELDISRHRMIELAAAATDLQVVVVSTPAATRRQERARARCTAVRDHSRVFRSGLVGAPNMSSVEPKPAGHRAGRLGWRSSSQDKTVWLPHEFGARVWVDCGAGRRCRVGHMMI